MSGIDLLKQLRAAGDNTPFILFTGKSKEEIAIEALNHGADFYLQKKMNADAGFSELLEKIRMAADQGRRGARISESVFNSLFHESCIPLFVHDHDTGRLLDANRAAWEAHGCRSREELLAMKVWNEPPYMMPNAMAYIDEVRANGRAEGEWKFIDSLHEERWMKVILEKIFVRGEQRIIIYSFDITDRVRKSSLMRAQLELQSVLASTSDLSRVLRASLHMALDVSGLDGGGIYLVQADGSLDLVHHEGLTEEFVKLTRRYQAGSPNAKVVMAGKAFFTNYSVFAERKHLENRFDELKALAMIPFSAEGRVVGAMILSSHAMENVPAWSQNALLFIAAETGLAASRARVMQENMNQRSNLRTLFSSVKDPIFIVGLEGVVVSCNNAALNTLGYTEEEIVGKTVLLAHPTERVEEVKNVVKGMVEGTVDHCSIPLRRKDGTEVPVETSVAKGIWDGKEVIFGISRDMTQIREAEESLRNMNHKMNLLSSITRHDIRNQLMVLRGYLDVASAEEDPQQLKTCLMKAGRAMNNIQMSIDKAKEYEELGSKRPEWQPIGDCFRSSAGRFDLQSVALTVDAQGWEVNADPMLPKVFHNLIENSLFHGGNVSRISFSAVKGEGQLLLCYEDDGKGIDDQTREWLFTKGMGYHGFGMFLSKQILALTGVTIEEKGEKGRGVKFVLTVPSGNFRAGRH